MWDTIRAWAGSAQPGRCKYCQRAIVWVMTDAGKSCPFNLGFTVRETVRDPRRGRAKFLLLDRHDRHDCQERTDARGGQDDNKRSHDGVNARERRRIRRSHGKVVPET